MRISEAHSPEALPLKKKAKPTRLSYPCTVQEEKERKRLRVRVYLYQRKEGEGINLRTGPRGRLNSLL